MARIVDKNTRLIDIDFGPVSTNVSRLTAQPLPAAVTFGGNGVKQLIRTEPDGQSDTGSFIQFVRIDLSHMTMNNEVMMPVDVNVQRTSPVPLGGMQNGTSFNAIEEYIYVFSRPLNNSFISGNVGTSTVMQNMRRLGLDRSALVTGDTTLGGVDAGIPTHEQTIYAEKRMYDFNQNRMATVSNGAIIPGGVLNEVAGEPTLTSVTTWGTLSAITGPNLYAYRVVYARTQSFDGTDYFNVGLDGISLFEFPPVNITFLCKDPNYSEGEYLTRLANAMNSLPEGGESA